MEAGSGSRLQDLHDDLEAKPLTSSRETTLNHGVGQGTSPLRRVSDHLSVVWHSNSDVC